MSSALLRRQLKDGKTLRRLGLFPYPHSFNKVNPAYMHYPQKDKYAEINRKYEEGDTAELAYQNIRKFPEWYKPYLANYHGHGYLAVYFMFMALYGWTYIKVNFLNFLNKSSSFLI